jgi:hypothetical protein
MNEQEVRLLVLRLLESLLDGAEVAHYAENDPSGYRTKYLVDGEEVRSRIAKQISEIAQPTTESKT